MLTQALELVRLLPQDDGQVAWRRVDCLLPFALKDESVTVLAAPSDDQVDHILLHLLAGAVCCHAPPLHLNCLDTASIEALQRYPHLQVHRDLNLHLCDQESTELIRIQQH